MDADAFFVFIRIITAASMYLRRLLLVMPLLLGVMWLIIMRFVTHGEIKQFIIANIFLGKFYFSLEEVLNLRVMAACELIKQHAVQFCDAVDR